MTFADHLKKQLEGNFMNVNHTIHVNKDSNGKFIYPTPQEIDSALPEINLRYRNGYDDDFPWVGSINFDKSTGLLYDEEHDALDDDSIEELLHGNDGKGADE